MRRCNCASAERWSCCRKIALQIDIGKLEAAKDQFKKDRDDLEVKKSEGSGLSRWCLSGDRSDRDLSTDLAQALSSMVSERKLWQQSISQT